MQSMAAHNPLPAAHRPLSAVSLDTLPLTMPTAMTQRKLVTPTSTPASRAAVRCWRWRSTVTATGPLVKAIRSTVKVTALNMPLSPTPAMSATGTDNKMVEKIANRAAPGA